MLPSILIWLMLHTPEDVHAPRPSVFMFHSTCQPGIAAGRSHLLRTAGNPGFMAADFEDGSNAVIILARGREEVKQALKRRQSMVVVEILVGSPRRCYLASMFSEFQSTPDIRASGERTELELE
jgi:hypothetical protein